MPPWRRREQAIKAVDLPWWQAKCARWRSAQAAKEIKTMIDDSVNRVSTGAIQVREAGDTMQEVVTAVSRVTDIMGDIASASDEQSRGIDQVGQAGFLQGAVSAFNIGNNKSVPPAATQPFTRSTQGLLPAVKTPTGVGQNTTGRRFRPLNTGPCSVLRPGYRRSTISAMP